VRVEGRRLCAGNAQEGGACEGSRDFVARAFSFEIGAVSPDDTRLAPMLAVASAGPHAPPPRMPSTSGPLLDVKLCTGSADASAPAWFPNLVTEEERVMKFSAKVSILIILAAAFVSFLLSVSLWFGVLGGPDRQLGIFVGLWVPSILALGAMLSPRGTAR
jgi:hypothetical protein